MCGSRDTTLMLWPSPQARLSSDLLCYGVPRPPGKATGKPF